MLRQLVDEIPPMSAEAFDIGRRRIRTRHSWVKARRAVRVLWFLALGLLPVVLAATGVYYLDLQVYRAGGLAWLRDVPLYVGFPGPLDGPRLPFTYPPIAAVFFSVLTTFPVWLANALVTVINFLALSVVCLIVTSRLTSRTRIVWTVAPAVAIVSTALEPVISTLQFGQINLVLMALVVTDCLWLEDRRWRGVLVGVAAAIKLTPLIFVLYFLARKDWRAALTSVVTFAALALAGFLAAPKDSVEYWFHALLDPGRVGGLAYMANQSIRGVLHRIDPGQHAETLLWLLLSAIVVLLAVVVARRTRNDVVALLGIALAGLLVSPVSWSHHWVWCVPALVTLGFLARNGTRVALVALVVMFCVQPFTWLPSTGDRELLWSWWQHIPGDAYVWIGITTLAVLVRVSAGRVGSRV